jgi:hypothetical protein
MSAASSNHPAAPPTCLVPRALLYADPQVLLPSTLDIVSALHRECAVRVLDMMQTYMTMPRKKPCYSVAVTTDGARLCLVGFSKKEHHNSVIAHLKGSNPKILDVDAFSHRFIRRTQEMHVDVVDMAAQKLRDFINGAPFDELCKPPTRKDAFTQQCEDTLARFEADKTLKNAWAYMATRPMLSSAVAATTKFRVVDDAIKKEGDLGRTFPSMQAAASYLRHVVYPFLFEDTNKFLTDEDKDSCGLRNFTLRDCYLRLRYLSERFKDAGEREALDQIVDHLTAEEKAMRFTSGNRCLEYLTLHHPICFTRKAVGGGVVVVAGAKKKKKKAKGRRTKELVCADKSKGTQ